MGPFVSPVWDKKSVRNCIATLLWGLVTEGPRLANWSKMRDCDVTSEAVSNILQAIWSWSVWAVRPLSPAFQIDSAQQDYLNLH